MNRNELMSARAATLLLVGSLALLGLWSPADAGPIEPSQEKVEAAKVAKKVERAKGAKHQAKEELEAVQEFQKEVAKYVRVHKNQLARLGQQQAVTAQALAAAIARDRAKAKQGDIFVREVQSVFRALIAEQLKGPDTLAARKAVAEGNPAGDEDSPPVVPRVNLIYPAGAMRSTVPASLLLTLPPLPECLHYRFVGRSLILVDSVAQIIVDYLPVATPTAGVK